MEKDNIAILMATYNGEQYLAEQIDSILNQTNKSWHLYVHDDGSSDNTYAILKDYSNNYPDKITIYDYPPQGGARNNFFSLLNKVEAPYYMFCDQDDVWIPKKISISLEAIKKQEETHPHKGIIICTDLFVVDENLSIIQDSMWKYSMVYPQYIQTFNDCGAQTAVTGCTMLFNQEAKNSCVYSTQKAIMHDSWVCLCTLKKHGILYGIHQQTVYYRQHGSNCLGVGMSPYDLTLKYRIKHFNENLRISLRYYHMLSSLEYGSFFKYYWYKFMYRRRIKRGYY